MDNGGFYNRRSPSVHFGGTSNYYSGIPDQAEAVNRVPSHTSGYAEIDLKLERLIKLVENQHKETESIKLNVEKFREEFDTLKSSVSAATAQSTLVSKRVPSKLSATVKHLQEKSEDNMKFAGDQPYNSEHNSKVKEDLIHKLSLKHSDDCSPRKIKKAVHRYYESRRRIFNDSRPSRIDSAKKAKRESRKKEMRKRLYSSRKKYLKREKEKKLWEDISWEYMTEESSGDEDFLNKHVLPWRSEALNHLIEKLENRAAKDSVASKCRYKRKERMEKSPSKCPVPSNAPKWAINTSMIISPVTTYTSVTPSVTPLLTTAVTSPVTPSVTPSVNTTVTPSVTPSVTTTVTSAIGGTPVASDDTPHRKRHKGARPLRRVFDFTLSSSEDSSSSSNNS